MHQVFVCLFVFLDPAWVTRDRGTKQHFVIRGWGIPLALILQKIKVMALVKYFNWKSENTGRKQTHFKNKNKNPSGNYKRARGNLLYCESQKCSLS